MSDRKPKHNRWLELHSRNVADAKSPISNRADSQVSPTPDATLEVPRERKSRKERLQEIRALLESGIEQKQSEPEPEPEPDLSSALVKVTPAATPPAPPHSATKRKHLKAYLAPVGLLFVLATPAGIAYIASNLLLRSPSLPNCPKIFWPVASASLRLYCAETAANKQTVNDLLVAIELVNALAEDHPLRPEINRQIEEWSGDILRLAEETFQAGELSGAIAMAKKIPAGTSAAAAVEQQIGDWRDLWKKAEGIYRKAEDLMREEQLNQAFREATRLLNVRNTYWETTKYQELTDLIQIAREDSKKLAEARNLGAQGSLDNLLAAIAKLEAISEDSHLKGKAQKEIVKFSKEIMALAEERLEAGDWQEAIATANKIPAAAKLQEEVKDFIVLARAHVPALLDTPEGLKDAIAQAQKLERGRPLYWKAQQYIRGWQQEIADVATLNQARQLARTGTVDDLKAAIDKLETIPASNPRGDEARAEMVRWTRKVEEIEDLPYLETADQLASFGDVDSLKAAIAKASQISRGRTLYDEAQARISEWRERSERLEYQPVLDRAQQLAAEGDFANAIAVAEQIKPDLTLYEEAQSDINQWRSQLQDIQNLKNAETAAAPGTIDGLIRAIQLAGRVSGGSSWRSRADNLIDDWSQTLLRRGLDQAVYDVAGAIETLSSIPSGTRVYNAAQAQIADWEAWLNPAPAFDPYDYEENPPSPAPDPIDPYGVPDLNKPITSDTKFLDPSQQRL
ncbi:MAG: hypothetical protein ACP5D7_08825 [Limnospira sp.]